MDQADLIKRIAEKLQIPGTLSQRLLRATLLEICDLLKNGEAVSIPGFGTFDTVIHKQRRGFLPLGFHPSGQGYALFPQRRVPVFRTAESLHDEVYELEEEVALS
ncbi:MAG: HU family DNA-binding protein [Pseudomonadales bacterium]